MVSVIDANDQSTFITQGRSAAHLDKFKFLTLCEDRVIDQASLELIQVLDLHTAIDHTATATGSAVLLRSLAIPSTDLNHICAKQDALREIASNDSLRERLQAYVHAFAKHENALYQFFNKGLRASFPYHDLKKAKHAAADLVRLTASIPQPESAYLNALLSDLRAHRGTRIDRMMNGTIHLTFGGLKPDDEVNLVTPKLRFVPRRFTAWAAAGPAVALTPYLGRLIETGPPLAPEMSILGMGWTGVYAFYGLFIKPIRDTENVIEPLRKLCVQDTGFARALDAVGEIDALLSLHLFAADLGHPTTLPKIFDKTSHFFKASGLKNPLLAAQKADFVANDVNMNGVKLTLISGPNSGGKTTICKSIVQNQLLAQLGGYVVADKAEVGIADLIRYQAPKFDGLQDQEGRFGTELRRTRDIFYATGPKSLVVLDELAEGTTFEETLHEAYGILSDFEIIGNNTILVTHNHFLLDRFTDEKKGQCLMVKFDADKPTYRLVPGISRVSHAAKIARKINFSQKDRHAHLHKLGYLKPEV